MSDLYVDKRKLLPKKLKRSR